MKHGEQTFKSTGIGAPIPRIEDRRLITGKGKYVDDISFPDMLHAAVVRSPFAHAQIISVDTTAACAMPGVVGVLTSRDTRKAGLGNIHCRTFPHDMPPNAPSYCPSQPILATTKVRHVGDRIALVVATSPLIARDAAELVSVKFNELPPVTLANACLEGTARVWDEATSNISFELESGDSAKVGRIVANAFYVAKLNIRYPRVSSNTLEPRGALAHPDPGDGRFTLYSSTQNPFRVRQVISEALGLTDLDMRVISMDVGGAFGMKGQTYPEEVLVAWAAKVFCRPVKWIADRGESFSSDMHGRDQLATGELAVDKDGRFLALRTTADVNVGAYLSYSGGVPPHSATVSYPGTYDIPQIYAKSRALFTTSSQLGPYRGSGKPEATFLLERLVDKAAREMGIDGIDLRRRNLISKKDMPYSTPGGYVYDVGDFEAVLNKTLALADREGFGARKAESARNGLARGFGLSLHCQWAGTSHGAGTSSERMEIRPSSDGSLGIFVGTMASGQGHETMYAQMVSGWLGVPIGQIRVYQGNTDRSSFGRGTFAERSMSTGGSALRLAADEVIRKGRRMAAWMFEAAEADIAFVDGVFEIPSTNRRLTFKEVAQRSLGLGVPAKLGIGLNGLGEHEGPTTFPNGCIASEVEIDLGTGKIVVDRMICVDDVGAVVNPVTLDGQLHGSIAQGLGEVLLEEIIFDQTNGQLLTGSFLDYAMPRADVMPHIASYLELRPTPSNPLGLKGGSEAGNMGAPAAIINATVDALCGWGVDDLPLPATSERVWRALERARRLKTT